MSQNGVKIPCLVLRGEYQNGGLSHYYDLLFSSVGLLCGGILIFQGWRLDPILLLCQMLSSGTAIFFIGETILLRDIRFQEKNKLLLFPYPSNKNKTLAQRQQLNTKLNWEPLQTNHYSINKFKLWNSNYKLRNSELKDYTQPIEYMD
uniref:Ycf66 n=1 Tax=Zygnema circumcarinatum TaxID=35869 RepID=A0A6N0GXE8_ZYGCR|nr:Ycf66 [Zygnema circumcarinatum]